jgi:hypothetical protein
MKTLIMILILILIAVFFSGCMGQKEEVFPDPPDGYSYLRDYSFENYGGKYVDEDLYSVHIDEGAMISKYFVLTNSYEGNVLLMRKNVTNQEVCYKDENMFGSDAGYYNKSDVDLFLTDEFFAKFPEWLQNKIVEIPIKIASKEAVRHEDMNSTIEIINRKIFLLARTEMAGRSGDAANEGKKLLYFDDWKVANPALNDKGDSASWWLRSSYLSDGIKAFFVQNGGQCGPASIDERCGTRPLFCLTKDTLVRISDRMVVDVE